MAHADVDFGRNCIVVNTVWNEKEVIKAVPGATYDGREKIWKLPLAWASCVTLRGVFRDKLSIGQDLQDWAWKYRATYVDPAINIRTLRDFASEGHEKHLFPFQRAGVEFIAIAGDVLLGDEMGTGKTVQALSALSHRIGSHETLPALIICPNSVKYQWAKETRKWFPSATPYILDGGIATKRKSLDQAKNDASAVVIVNIESVRLLSRLAPYGSVRLKKCTECDPYGDPNLKKSNCEVHRKEFNNFGFQTVIFDEAHRAKDPKSKQTRGCWAVMHDASVKRRWALTGTPIAQHPGDLWSIMHSVAPYDFPVKSKFVERYCLTSWNAYGGLDIVGVKPDTRDELFSFLDPHFRRMTKDLVLTQLPKKVRETRYVDMSAAQKKMYKEMARDLFTYTDTDELLITPNQLTATTRLCQIAAASVHVDKPDPDDPTSWNVSLKNPSSKLDEFEQILDDIGDVPCVAAAEHKKIIDLASERLKKLGVPHATITGDVSQYDRDQAMRLLNERRIKVLLFTVKAGGTGLDMSAADTIINLQRSWSLIDAVQTENRVHRIGSEQHQSVRIIDIITRDTIEETQVERLYVKLERLEEITRDRAMLAAAGRDTSTLDNEEARIMQTFLGVPDGANHGDA